MHTVHNPDGTLTVTAPGHHRLSELRDHAALAFATILERAVDWPALVRTTELAGDSFAATFTLPGRVS